MKNKKWELMGVVVTNLFAATAEMGVVAFFFFRGADSGSRLSKRYAQKLKLGVDGSRSY